MKPITKYILIGACLLCLFAISGAILYFARIYLEKNQNPPQDLSELPVIIVYDDNGFHPNHIGPVRKTVTIINKSSKPFQPMSERGYTTWDKNRNDMPSGCLNTYVGACSPIMPGDSWSIRFGRPSNYLTDVYQDELKPSAKMFVTF